MSGKRYIRQRGWCLGWMASAVILTATWSVSAGKAQTPISEPATPAAAESPSSSSVQGSSAPSSEILQAGCASCGKGLFGGHKHGLDGMPGPSITFGDSGNPCHGGCITGRTIKCTPCESDNCVGQFFCGLYECICCPDPCYDPRWMAVADTAFFQDAARPVTQMRVRWDNAFNFRTPDRAEFFQARARTNPNQIGPAGPCAPANIPGKGPNNIVNNLDFQELSLYNEAGTNSFSAFTEFGYRHIDPEASPLNARFGGALCPISGFTDMTAGTKAVLLDCELLLLTFQFKTYIPTGNFLSGLGIGHLSLEPSFLANLKLSPITYLQAQLAYWIPIAADPLYAGDVLHFHTSLNHVLWCGHPSIQLIGNLELNTWAIQGGAFTSPDVVINDSPVALSAKTTIVSGGPGIRLFICDKFDVGVGAAFALTDTYWAETLVRAEFRMRF